MVWSNAATASIICAIDLPTNIAMFHRGAVNVSILEAYVTRDEL